MEGMQKLFSLHYLCNLSGNLKLFEKQKYIYLNVKKKLYWDIIHMPFTMQNLMFV